MEKTMSDLMMAAGADAATELGQAIIRIAGEVIQRHGDSDHVRNMAVVAAGIAFAVQEIGLHIDPVFPETVRKTLEGV